MDAVGARSIVDRLRAAGCVSAEQEAALLLGTGLGGADLDDLVAQRESGRPLEYLLGWAEFAGLRIPVTDGVFVPRRRSELLARLATDAARQAAAILEDNAAAGAPTVVDLCCGAGALGAVVASRVPGVRLHGVDLDPAAVECARRATAPFGGLMHSGDLYAALPAALHGRVDVLIANAPYVPTREIAFLPTEARDFERPAALDGGVDGLAVLRRVLAGAPRWLAPGGIMLMECADHQAATLAGAVAAAALAARIIHDDAIDATVVTGRMP